MAECLILGVGGGASGSDDVTATAAQVLAPYTAITSDSDGEPKAGTMPTKAAATYYATTSEQTINAGQYLSGAQKIGKLSQTNLSAGNVRKGISIYINNGNANVFSTTGSWYGNKKTIGACAWCGRGLGDPNPSETQSFTMPDSGTVYYGGMSSGYYGGSGNCRIYKNNSVVDNRDLGTYYVRGSMFNKSFAANKGDVIKVEATATSGDATVTCIQAVIVY